MMRAFLCSAALLGFATVCVAADAKDAKDNTNDNGMRATIVKVDAKTNNITLKWKDKNGKDEEHSFDLTKDVKLTDENGKTLQADSLKEGQQVRITENNGKLTAPPGGEGRTERGDDHQRGRQEGDGHSADEGQGRQGSGAHLHPGGGRPLFRQHGQGGGPGRVPIRQ